MNFKLLLAGLFVFVLASNGFASNGEEWTIYYSVTEVVPSGNSTEWIIHYYVNPSSDPAYSHEWSIHYYVASDGNVYVCDCPVTGNWEITEDCELSNLCNAPKDVHLNSGTLQINNTGILSISSGNKVIIEDLNDTWLAIIKGGQLILND